MALVAPINLPFNVRTLWFDPNGLDIHAGDNVVVQTVRGLELGVAAADVTEVEYEAVKRLKSPMKPVVRIATEEDLEQAKEMERKSREAMPTFKELARETSEDMHPVSVEYLLDGDKAIFYFEAEERIDFRELVRKLASHFHVRIDMHQIGVRDEARIIGGIAHCGQEVCCKRLGGEFKPVSIRMAKDQDLSLNPQKISGLCGRLMCCLRYETDAYTDFKSRAPKMNAKIKTPAGEAKVVNLDVPKEVITVQIEDEKPVKVPLALFKEPKEGKRPDTITQEGWDEANQENEISFETASIFNTSHLTGEDKLGSAKAVHHPTKKRSTNQASRPTQSETPAKETHRKQRKRRSTVISGGQGATSEKGDGRAQKKQAKQGTASEGSGRTSRNRSKQGSSSKLRPGHKSSGLSGADAAKSGSKPSSKGASKPSKGASNRSNAPKSRNDSASSNDANKQGPHNGSHRRRRRRRSSGAQGSQGNQGGSSTKTEGEQ